MEGCRGYEKSLPASPKPQLLFSDLRLTKSCGVEVVVTNHGPGGFPKYPLAGDYRGKLNIVVTAGDKKEPLWTPDWPGISEEKAHFQPEGSSALLPLNSRMELVEGQPTSLTATLGPVGSAPGNGASSFSKVVTRVHR